jgi:nucleotide-binding universal stress UspA family protein
VSAAADRIGERPPMLLDGVVQPLRTIVALAELSPKSDNAVARAALLAREHGATLRLLHVVAARSFPAASSEAARDDDTTACMERARRALLALAARTASAHRVDADCCVRAGDALQVIVDETRGADLVVVAAKRGNALRDFVLKAPTERLLRIVQRPVLLVKRAALDGYAELLVADTATSHGGVLVESLAHRRDARDGDALVVVRKEARSSMASFLLGTPAQRLVAHASCDVLVLPKAVAAAARKHARERRRMAIDARRQAKATPAA